VRNYLPKKSIANETADHGSSYNRPRAGPRPDGARARPAGGRAGPDELRPGGATAGSPGRSHSDAAKSTFVYLGVVVADETIYRLSALGRRTSVLGPLAGATAEVTDGTGRRDLPRVLHVVGALSKRTGAAAFVVTADGELARHRLDGVVPVRQAQAQIIEFNALVQRSALSHPSAG
jgi:hypothetical protein